METVILPANAEGIKKAADILLSGGVIGMPTETVYGLAAVGTMPQAVKEIFRIKGRPTDNPLIAHVHKDYDIEKLVLVNQSYAFDLMKKFMPGPLTLVFDSKKVVCEEAVCGGDTLAIRMPSHPACQKLLREVDMPVVAPSANKSKHTSPVCAQHVFDDLGGEIPLILDGGQCTGGIESTVLDVTDKTPRILRAGLITREMITAVVGRCEIAEHKEGDRVKSPGVKYGHYKPRCETALYKSDELATAKERYQRETASGKRVKIMCDKTAEEFFTGCEILPLGETGEEIAAHLYEMLLTGEKTADMIIAIEPPREDGVFAGVLNRLRKSCGL